MEPVNMSIKIGNISTTLLLDSGSACSILNRSLAPQVVRRSPHAFLVHNYTNQQLRTFLNESICIEGKLQAPVSGNGRTSHLTTFTVAAADLKSLIGRGIIDQLGIAVTQSSSLPGNQVNTISPSSEFNERIALTFPNLISRVGLKNYAVKSNFHKNF